MKFEDKMSDSQLGILMKSEKIKETKERKKK